MWKLTIEDDEGQRTSLDLSLDEYSIGRAEDASIRLTERNVSRRHVRLASAEDGWVVYDEGSYNGTYLNGERVEEQVGFLEGDVLQLGDYRIELSDASLVQPSLPQEARQVRPDRLVMVIGPAPGHEFPLAVDRISIGRTEDCDVSINHGSVSRLHAEMHLLGQARWEVVDAGSANGIRINGVDLHRGIVEPGDAIEFGDVRLRYVAAGKYFRPAVDVSQQLPAIAGFEPMASSSAAASNVGAKRNAGRLVAVVVALVAVVGLVALLMTNKSGNDNPAPASSAPAIATSEAEAKTLLKAAHRLADEKDDLAGAHNMLKSIPDGPVRDSDAFRALEDRWADSMFKLVEQTTKLDQKRKILNEISEAKSVSQDKRLRAAKLASELGPAIDLDRPRRSGSKARAVPASRNQAAAQSRTSTAPGKPKPKKAGSNKFDMTSQKSVLLSKLNSGTASESNLKALRSICSTQGDRACRNRAHAALQAIRKKKNK
jgi:ABC transport system ATP-binding/permease protein